MTACLELGPVPAVVGTPLTPSAFQPCSRLRWGPAGSSLELLLGCQVWLPTPHTPWKVATERVPFEGALAMVGPRASRGHLIMPRCSPHSKSSRPAGDWVHAEGPTPKIPTGHFQDTLGCRGAPPALLSVATFSQERGWGSGWVLGGCWGPERVSA